MKESLTNLEKVQDLLHDEDNAILLRIALVVVGIVLGGILVLLSSLFDDKTLSMTFLVFGCVTFGGFLFASAIWWMATS